MSDSIVRKALETLAVLSFFKQFLNSDDLQAIFDHMDDVLSPLSGPGMAHAQVDASCPGGPQVIIGDQRFSDESAASLAGFTDEYQVYHSFIGKYVFLAEQYPLRAAALNMRLFVMILTPIFEDKKFDLLDDALISKLITLLLHIEYLNHEGGCERCSRATHPLS